MSEFQYYEWQTIDRPLTIAEQKAVGQLSSHIDVTATLAVVTYNWSSFKHDPKQVLADYFDAMLYMANWGSRRLMFRFPKGLVDVQQVQPYCLYGFISFESLGNYEVLDIELNEEDGSDWVEAEGILSGLISLRNDILRGDYRALYLAWLKAITLDDPEIAVRDKEPPIPPGLRNLDAALHHLVKILEIDPYLLKAAASASPELQAEVSESHLREAITRLPREACDALMLRLVQGETNLSVALLRMLQPYLPPGSTPVKTARRVHRLFKEARQLREQAQKRQAEEAERKRIEELHVLAQREGAIWQEVEALILTSQAKSYDQAVSLLRKLKELAVFQGNQASFADRVMVLAQRYKSRYSLMERLKKARLTSQDEGSGAAGQA